MTSLCSCASVGGGALSPRVPGKEGEPERLRVQLHSAKLERSFAKAAGWMDPYAVVSIDGREVYRTSPALWSHKNPSWKSDCTIRAAEAPRSLTVAVWTQNRLRKDVLCGTVTLPCADDMCTLKQKEFAITIDSKLTGSICLSVMPLGQRFSTRANTMMSVASALGGEMDNIANFLDDDETPKGDNEDSGAGFSRSGSVVMAEPGDKGVVCLRSEDQPAEHPNLLSPKKSSDSLKKPSTPTATGINFIDPPGAEKEKATVAKTEAEVVTDTAKCGDDDLATPLAGGWNCVATTGLEEFLKATGVPAFYRRFALSARWPSWDFNVSKGHVHFINHSAMGDLHEHIPLDGSNYIWKDGRGNPLTCSAKWTPSADGGVLTIWRTGTVSGNTAKYSETRTVSGSSLVFELDNGDGLTWGRTFERKA
mmetsp:Transcript_36240/g.91217  ORF Transcript_36240/g.91217 Transcript_36240/m.91217 type:complete len:422 (+) Transcript_36240:52-1317(+)|eukprot:CAMPEP_0115251558 /NCGR_PEP_ID=MMETSP0270-20121206/43691_1 /TAXON_ID=71861 /ORGANISM="Scrippsiella trochoidea, Strain CCMP3099" /LENGTH=421 /DNA_ID=CAMNT_0002666981 /DNA_START=52 /DNA_END=1317 /DNA_ORIENTATION=-